MQPKQGLLIANNSTISDEQLLKIIQRNEKIEDFYHIEPEAFARSKFACVKRIKHRKNGKQYAAKIMKKRRLRHNNVTDEILHEIRVLLLSIESERIVKLYEVYETDKDFTLVLELAEGGELQKVLDEDEIIDEQQCRRIIKQIIEGIQYLHRKNIAHLDIKPQNILLTDKLPNGNVKLCDFGISRLIDENFEVREIMGTVDYMPPEILQYEPISLASDMWSLGILTYVLLSGHSPFGGDDKQQTYSNITSSDLEFPDKLFSNITNLAIDFIIKLLNRDPKKRLNCNECLKHPWLSSIDNNEKLLLQEQQQQTSDLEEDVDDNDNENENDDVDNLIKRTKLRSETLDSKSSSMTLSSISSLDEHLDNHQQQQQRQQQQQEQKEINEKQETNDNDKDKENMMKISTSPPPPPPTSSSSSNCDSGLDENICDTTTTTKNNDQNDKDCNRIDNNCHNNYNDDDDNEFKNYHQQNMSQTTTTLLNYSKKYNQHKRLSSDIFPDHKSFISIVQSSNLSSLLQSQSQYKTTTTTTIMRNKSTSESSMLSKYSGDRKILIQIQNNNNSDENNEFKQKTMYNNNNNNNKHYDDHSPPSTPSKKINLSIDDNFNNVDNNDDEFWRRNFFSTNLRSSLSMQRLNNNNNNATWLHNDNDDQIKSIPLITIETHSLSKTTIIDNDNNNEQNENNNQNNIMMLKSLTKTMTTSADAATLSNNIKIINNDNNNDNDNDNDNDNNNIEFRIQVNHINK